MEFDQDGWWYICQKYFLKQNQEGQQIETKIEMAGMCRKGLNNLGIRRWRKKAEERDGCDNIVKEALPKL